MANPTKIFPYAKYLFATAAINWLTDTFKVLVVDDADKPFSYTAYRKLSDIYTVTPTNQISAELANKTCDINSGVCDADDAIFAGIPATPPKSFDWWCIMKMDLVTIGNSIPIVGGDEVAAGFPLVPNGSSVRLIFSNGQYKIFVL